MIRKLNSLDVALIVSTIVAALFVIATVGLATTVRDINKLMDKLENHKDTVFIKRIDTVYLMRGTVYWPHKGQTDKSPLITACGYKIDKNNPIKSKIIALPQHMIKNYNSKAPFSYGDIVTIKGDFPYTGIWIVGDCTNKRVKNTIDFCTSPKDPTGMWSNIKLSKYND